MVRRRGAATASAGTTLVELLVTSTILTILAAAALPVAAVSVRREREIELRRALREIRSALDTYHVACLTSRGQGGSNRAPATAGGPTVSFTPEDDPDLICFPKELDVLVEGVETNIPDYTLRFLRKIPEDPMNVGDEDFDSHGWRLRSTSDDPDGNVSWDRKNVFDVSSGSEWRALDGSYYKDW